ncbi:hypothetical protein [Sphingomonas sp. CFBP8993]|uniref:hypothetical protein n=1 Tax=Sphingomonas sp. CFBP8993 TaxID=3096526 RepID=UPI002A6B2C3F|nr:hypothetical protein [Sphingomonas sp. CFBP8993]
MLDIGQGVPGTGTRIPACIYAEFAAAHQFSPLSIDPAPTFLGFRVSEPSIVNNGNLFIFLGGASSGMPKEIVAIILLYIRIRLTHFSENMIKIVLSEQSF